MSIIEQLSSALADQLAAAAPCAVAIKTGGQARSGILWRPDVVVTSEQVVGEAEAVSIGQDGRQVAARLAGRDPATNVCVFRLETPLPGSMPALAPLPRVGALAMVVGRDAAGGPTGRLAMIHATGDAWQSMAGARIDSLIRLDVRLGADEGGPVLDAGGLFLGMSTAGPRRRGMVIPAATIARVVDPLLAHGHIARGWLGVGLQPVAIPARLHGPAGQARGAMVLQLVDGGPAATAGLTQGDILLSIDDFKFGANRRLTTVMAPERIGESVPVRFIRMGEIRTIQVVIAARPVS